MTVNKTLQPLLTPREAAEFLNISMSTLANWRAQKTHFLSYIKLGKRRIRYSLRDIENFLDGKKPKVQNEVSIITQYDIDKGYWVDIGYFKGKQVWVRKHKEIRND